MTAVTTAVHGAGLGLRRSLMGPLAGIQASESGIGFLEIAPENWMDIGGKYERELRELTERFPFVSHGLSLSIGSPAALDEEFVRRLRRFLDAHGIRDYTEHLTWCSDDGHLYDLLPIPFTRQAANYVIERIQRVQDLLGRRIALENASYYAAPGAEMSELDFIRTVLEGADCDLLLDVNNIYVNSINHHYNAEAFLDALPGDRIRYMHIAGHYEEAEDLRVDTHGSDVIEPVWQLLDRAYRRHGVAPTLLERDFNIPPLPQLMREMDRIHSVQSRHLHVKEAVHG